MNLTKVNLVGFPVGLYNRLMCKERAVLLVLLVCLYTSPLGAQTPACGSEVSGSVVFNGDMTCTLNDLEAAGRVAALTVVADGTTINLAGFAMSCSDSITFQSCQGRNVSGSLPQTPIAIDVNGFSNVTIKGPGTIAGFDRSIVLTNVPKASVVDLTITGPTSDLGPFIQSTGPLTTGIRVIGGRCPGAIILDGNVVSNHRYGIVLDDSSCVKVQRNQVRSNRGFDYSSHGIHLLNSPDNTVTNNWVEMNGLYNPTAQNTAADGGITLEGATTTGNRVSQNTLINNCGDGISARNGAQGNPIGGNSARSNGVADGARCRSTFEGDPLVPAYDFAEYNAVSVNAWRKNNDCATQNSVVPAGICTTTLP